MTSAVKLHNTPERITANHARKIFQRLRRHMPNPHTQLCFSSAFELLIAVMLSAQSTDASVNKATALLFKIARTPWQIEALGENGLRPYIATIGLHNMKAKHIIATCRLLIARHNGEVPAHRQALEALPGVGRKTANVVLNEVFHQPTVAVDTHVYRVAHRTGLAQGSTVSSVEQQLLQCIPKQFLLHAHHWLILHGRHTCKARNPLCGSCVLADICPSALTASMQKN